MAVQFTKRSVNATGSQSVGASSDADVAQFLLCLQDMNRKPN